jgi:transposase
MTPEDALALIAVLQEQVAQQEAANQALREQVATLEQRIAELEALKTPPGWAKPNRPKRARPAGTPRRARAPEHNRGRRRGIPTRLELHAYERCPACAYALCGGTLGRRREVIELPDVPIEVVEHRLITRYCPACAAWKTPRLPAGVALGQSRIGGRLASLIGTLRTVHRLPLAQIQHLLATLYGLHLSVGGLHDLLRRLRGALAPVRAELEVQARASPSQHLDETGWRENGQNGYVWTQATAGSTPTRLFTYDPSRAGAVADRLLEGYAGVVVSDGYAAYDHLPLAKQRCWAHLLRTAHKLKETYPQDALLREWVGALKTLYGHAQAVAQQESVTPRQRAAAARDAERRMRRLTRCYRTQSGHPAQTLAAWLHQHEDELFTFVRTPGVEGTNNQAERAIRPFVIGRKVSGGSRSPAGSAIRCDLASVFLTWTARGLNPLTTCLAALQSPLPQL